MGHGELEMLNPVNLRGSARSAAADVELNYCGMTADRGDI